MEIKLAPVLSFVIPGLGQIGKLRFASGYLFFIAFVIIGYYTITKRSIFLAVFLLILHVINIIDAEFEFIKF